MKVKALRSIRTLIAASLCLALTAGCGSEDGPTYATVSGKVTMNSEPITVGTVLFTPTGDTKGPAAAGPIKADGTYEIVGPAGKGLPVGTHKVMLLCPEAMSGADTGEDEMANVGPCLIPEKYQQEETSDISKTVVEGENKIDLELTP